MAIQVFGERRKDRNTQEALPLSAVTNLTAVASGSSVTVTWSDPTGNGGNPVNGFYVGRDGNDVNGSGPWSTTVTALTHSFKFTNLAVGVTYNFTVYPITAVQNGPALTVPATISTTVPPTNTTRGAVAIGTASRTVPQTNVLYIDSSATNGDTNGDGTIGNPYRTLDKARNAATTTGVWTIVCRAGIYHESITNSSASKQYFIQNYPGEIVWFDGSTIRTDWTNNGNGTWSAPLTAVFQKTLHDASGITPAMKAEGGASSTAGFNEQVFRDGVLLQSIANDATPTSGQFSIHNYGNSGTQTVFIADNPSGHEMRISDLRTLWTANNITHWYGVGVRRYASDQIEKPLGAAMYYGGTSDGSTFENVWFSQNGIAAFGSTKSDLQFTNCSFEYNGQMGISSTTCDGMIVTRCVLQYNNTRLWQAGPSTGAIKLTRGDTILIDDCLIYNNNMSNGLWFDWSCIRVTVRNSEVGSTSSLSQSGSSKGATGIQFEEIDGGFIGGSQHYCYVVNNTIYGFRWNLRVIASGYFKVWYNTFDNHSESDIYVSTDRGPNPGNDGRPYAEDPWITRNVEINNNDFKDGNSVYAQIINFDTVGINGVFKSGGDQTSSVSGNRFAPLTGGHQYMWGLGGASSSHPTYDTTAAILALPGMSGKNWVNYQQSSLPADGSAGEVMPADIASVLGKTAGIKHIGTF